MKLGDLSPLMGRLRARGLSYGYDRSRADPMVAQLRWPDDVLEQFVHDFGDNAAFVNDYGSIDLHEIKWQLDTIPAAIALAHGEGCAVTDDGVLGQLAGRLLSASCWATHVSQGAGAPAARRSA
ncbi:hypothetical protein [Streptomyces venezuelae]